MKALNIRDFGSSKLLFVWYEPYWNVRIFYDFSGIFTQVFIEPTIAVYTHHHYIVRFLVEVIEYLRRDHARLSYAGNEFAHIICIEAFSQLIQLFTHMSRLFCLAAISPGHHVKECHLSLMLSAQGERVKRGLPRSRGKVRGHQDVFDLLQR